MCSLIIHLVPMTAPKTTVQPPKWSYSPYTSSNQFEHTITMIYCRPDSVTVAVSLANSYTYECTHASHSHFMDIYVDMRVRTHGCMDVQSLDKRTHSKLTLLLMMFFMSLWSSQASQQQRPLRAGGHRSLQGPVPAQENVGHSEKLQQWRKTIQLSKETSQCLHCVALTMTLRGRMICKSL